MLQNLISFPNMASSKCSCSITKTCLLIYSEVTWDILRPRMVSDLYENILWSENKISLCFDHIVKSLPHLGILWDQISMYSSVSTSLLFVPILLVFKNQNGVCYLSVTVCLPWGLICHLCVDIVTADWLIHGNPCDLSHLASGMFQSRQWKCRCLKTAMK